MDVYAGRRDDSAIAWRFTMIAAIVVGVASAANDNDNQLTDSSTRLVSASNPFDANVSFSPYLSSNAISPCNLTVFLRPWSANPRHVCPHSSAQPFCLSRTGNILSLARSLDNTAA